MPTKSHPTSFRFGPELDEEVSQLAKSLEIPRAQLIKKAIKHFIARQKHIDAVLAEARESYVAYKATGRGVPWEEASKWMRSGGGKADLPVLKDMRK